MIEGSTYTCANHPTLRWWDTKPGGKLIFDGELLEDGTIREAYTFGWPPLRSLRSYLNGKNPFDERLDLEGEPWTWEKVVEFVAWVKEVEEKGYVFECECPPSALTRIDKEPMLRYRAKT